MLLQRDFTSLLYFEKKFVLHIGGEVFEEPLFTIFLLRFTGHEICNVSNKYQLVSNLAKQYFYTRDFISLLHFRKVGTLHHKRFSKHPLFTVFSRFWTVSEACNISNKYWLLNKSPRKTFFHKTPFASPFFKNVVFSIAEVSRSIYFLPFFISKKKLLLSIAELFRNTHFLPHFYAFSYWMRSAKFQIKVNLLIN